MTRSATLAAVVLLAACDAPATAPVSEATSLNDANVTLTLAVRGRGEVAHTADAAGAVTCSTMAATTESVSCARSYALNQAVTLEPKPAAGWVFDHWSGRCAGKTGTCTTTLNERLTIEAVFKLAPATPPANVTLTLAVRGRGEVVHTTDQAGLTTCSTVAPNPEAANCVRTYALNAALTLQPKPAAGWVFDHWSGRCAGKTGECTTTMNERLTMEAIFRLPVVTPSTYTLKIVVRGHGAVKFPADQAGATSCTPAAATPELAECTLTYPAQLSVRLEPQPVTGYRFTSWSGVCTASLTSPCTVTMNESRTIEARFQL